METTLIKDYSSKTTLQISNDAFYYLRDGEEPLDEDNLEEAAEVQEMFPLGFEIESFEPVEGDDTIEVVFIPLMPAPEKPVRPKVRLKPKKQIQTTLVTNEQEPEGYKPDEGINGYIVEFGGWVFEFTIISEINARIRVVNEAKKKVLHDGEIAEIVWYYDRPWINYSGGAMPLWREYVKVLKTDEFGILKR